MSCKICCKRERYSTMNKIELQREIQDLKEEIKQLKEKQETGPVTQKRDWYISLKNAQGQWMNVITLYDRTLKEAENHAENAMTYYEGTIDWKIKMIV